MGAPSMFRRRQIVTRAAQTVGLLTLERAGPHVNGTIDDASDEELSPEEPNIPSLVVESVKHCR